MRLPKEPRSNVSPNLKCAFAWSIASSCVEREGGFVYRRPLFFYVVNLHARSPIPLLLQALRLVIFHTLEGHPVYTLIQVLRLMVFHST
jgi:hypothetical protein